MKMKFGALVVAGSGKIGGHVAARNSSGAYLRTKVTPINPRTEAQVAVRARMSANAKSWTVLSQAQRNAWNSSSDVFKSKNVFGDDIKLSGINIYSRLNNNLACIGETLITNPPVPSSVGGPTTASVVSAVTLGVLTVESDIDVPTNNTMVIRATSPQSQGKSFVKSEFRVIAQAAAATSGPIDISADYIAKFGALPLETEKVFCEIYFISTVSGIASGRAKGSDITAS